VLGDLGGTGQLDVLIAGAVNRNGGLVRAGAARLRFDQITSVWRVKLGLLMRCQKREHCRELCGLARTCSFQKRYSLIGRSGQRFPEQDFFIHGARSGGNALDLPHTVRSR
jgi:hypothetical protein